MTDTDTDHLALVAASGRVLRRAESAAEAAKDARDEAVREAVGSGLSQRAVARAAEVSEPMVRKILTRADR